MKVSSSVMNLIREKRQARDDLASANLRVVVDGNSLGEDSFKIRLDSSTPGADDKVISEGDVSVVMDPHSAKLLEGVLLDCEDGELLLKYSQ